MTSIGTAIANANGAFSGHPHLHYRFYGGAAVLLLTAGLAAVLKKPEQGTAQLEITPGRLRLLGSGGSHKRDFLMPVRVELLTPTKVRVKGCSIKLFRNGRIQELKAINDVEDYDLHDSVSVTPRRIQPLAPLPTKLGSGDPVDGWVHFATSQNEYEIQSSELTLIVHTSCGDGNAAILSSAQSWDDGQETFVARRF